jgi:CheY-like chemotaxis protein/glycine cleavage system H lipoate-binding protein
MENKMTNPGEKIKDTTSVLVIDDEEIVHASLRRILTRFGYEVEAVFSAHEGLALLEQKKFDLVTVDLMMPEMNGIQFLEQLGEKNIQLPVIMVTGYPTIQTAVQALRLGAVDYIAKPFTRKELLSPVQRALSQEGDDAPMPGVAGEAPKTADLKPGVGAVLPRHAWAEFQQDGTFLVGVDQSFMRIFDQVTSVSLPDEMDLVEQGYIGIYLRNENDEEHGVAMPLSGQVVEINKAVQQEPSSYDADTWLIRIIPSHLDEELGRLVLRSSG